MISVSVILDLRHRGLWSRFLNFIKNKTQASAIEICFVLLSVLQLPSVQSNELFLCSLSINDLLLLGAVS